MVTPQEQEEERLKVLREHCQFLFNPKGRSVLYIGGAPGKIQIVNELRQNHRVYLLEAYRPNLEAIAKEKIFSGYLHADIRKVTRDQIIRAFGLIDHLIWWHGPEHVTREEFAALLPKLKTIAQKSIILACPYGILEQGPVAGNEYERHLSTYIKSDFNYNGFEVESIGSCDSGVNSCLIAWMEL